MLVSLMIAPSGKMLVARFDAAPTAVGTAPTVTVNGSAATLGQAIWSTTEKAVFWPLATVTTGATVLLSAASGWVTLGSGAVAAQTGAVVANRGAILTGSLVSTGALRVGYNLTGQYYGNSALIYSNGAKSFTYGIGGTTLAADANGYPTLIGETNYLLTVSDPGTDYGGAGKGAHSWPPGKTTVIFDGTNVVAVIPFAAPAETTSGAPDFGHATGNRIVIDFRDNARFSPNVQLLFTGTATGTGDNHSVDMHGRLEIYPPDPADPSGNTAWASPTKYHPSLRAQFGQAEGWRCMDGIGTNGCNAREVADLVPYAAAGFSMYARRERVAVSKVEPYTGSDTYVFPFRRTVALVTTTGAHGFSTGDVVGFGSGIGSYQAPGVGGSTTTNNMSSQGGCIKVLSSTTFTVGLAANIDSAPMSNTLTPTPGPEAVALRDFLGGGIPWDDCGNITAHLGAKWMRRNLPHLLSDAAIAAIATRDAATMPAGSKVFVEFSNEVWNDQFFQSPHARAMTREFLGGGTYAGDAEYIPWQLYRGIQAYRAYRTAWVAAGRSASDCEHFFGISPGPQPSDMTKMLALAHGAWSLPTGTADTVVFDLINGVTTRVISGVTTTVTYAGLGTIDGDIHHAGPGPYLDFTGMFADSSLATVLQSLDADQLADLTDWHVESGYNHDWMAGFKTAIDNCSLSVKPQLSGYEANMAAVVPGGAKPGWPSSTGSYQKESAGFRHPRAYNATRAWLAQLESAGMRTLDIYFLNGGNARGQFSTYMGPAMVAGTGASSENPDYTDLLAVRSQVGGAVNAFVASAPGGIVPDDPDPTTGMVEPPAFRPGLAGAAFPGLAHYPSESS